MKEPKDVTGVLQQSDEKMARKKSPYAPSHYVGVGASAGGLEAIEQFFKPIPSNCGLAFVVIQHLSPDYKSLMVELLSKKTELTVLRAEDGMAIQANHVYLIPPRQNLRIFHGKLVLQEQVTRVGVNLPIDIFLRSLAEEKGEKAIGVILSGTGSDGARGIRAIKEAGGIVMVQSEESAKFDGMPKAAIATGVADFVLTPSQLAQRLLDFVLHPNESNIERSERLLSDEGKMAQIFSLLREQTGVDFTHYKPSTIIRRLERRMIICDKTDIEDYVQHLFLHPTEVSVLYKQLLIGVTSFFRDADAMEVFSERYLSERLQQHRNAEFRMWVAGCATGEEAYTLAILTNEIMVRHHLKFDVKIFATDLDKDALVVAGSGVYPESITADLSPELIGKYFIKNGDHFQVSRHIRSMVVFARHNLIKDPPFTNMNVITCRNLLIYLQPVLQKRALQMFSYSLVKNGVLFLGTSETIGEMGDHFSTLEPKMKIYASLGRGRSVVGQTIHVPYTEETAVYGETTYFSLRPPMTRIDDDSIVVSRILDAICPEVIPLLLVVNAQFQVLYT
ncbi:MAG: chemotaxis protein CheR, partial [Deltaproteobacteria bacterium]|nr:chemotaxis protein CheR [Deltaproteobacteria bacterium]